MLIFEFESKPSACSLFCKLGFVGELICTFLSTSKEKYEKNRRIRFYVHFLPTSARNEPKKRRSRGEGSRPRKSEHAAFSRSATSSPLKEPLSCRQSRQKGFIDFNK